MILKYPRLARCKILSIGNICAGKTTLVRELCRELEIEPAILDDFRTRYGDGTIAGDYLAYYHLLRDCASPDPGVVEFSGAGPHKWAVRLALRESTLPIIVFFLDTPVEICLARANTRVFDVPYPNWDIPPSEVIPKLAQELRTDLEEGFWSTSIPAKIYIHNNSKPLVELLAQIEQDLASGEK